MDVNKLLKDFFELCESSNNSLVIIEDNKVSISENKNEVVLELIFNNENKLSLNFFKSDSTSDDYVNELMEIFNEAVNKQPLA